ncbi:MAG: aspartyl protease family protein, partial [Acidobacteria bacterium]|nr:aspartyl protease family protein [Acidobacteriota bacterium]
MRSGDFKAAAASYRRLVEQGPASDEARATLVRALVRNGDLAEASLELDKALQVAPNSAAVQVAAGDVFFRRAAFHKALAAYQKASELDARYAPAWLGLSRVSYCLSLSRSAQNHIRKAHECAPDDPDVLAAWASLLRSRPDHIAALERVLASYDKDSKPARNLKAHIAADKAVGDRKTGILASPYHNAEIPLRTVAHGPHTMHGWALRVGFNDKEPISLLLDTGAGGISVSRRAADRFRLEYLGEEGPELLGVGDEKPVPFRLALAKKVQVGDVIFENHTVTVADRTRDADADGLIGTDVFSQFLVRLDFPKGKLRLTTFPNQTAPPNFSEG